MPLPTRQTSMGTHAWMHRTPGGLGVAIVFACALFAAVVGSSGGTLGILLPPSITMVLYAVAAELSLGRLFLAAVGTHCGW
jgi:C4-dicarboxylate transporter, DctM subunit